MSFAFGKTETALHVLSRVSKVVHFDEILDNAFEKCLSRVTALHVKFYSPNVSTPLVSPALLNHIIARSILPRVGKLFAMGGCCFENKKK